MPEHRSLGIDAGLASTGLVGLVGSRVYYHATVTTPSGDDDWQRIDFIEAAIEAAIELTQPAIVVVEDYEYQGSRSHTMNSIRTSRVVAAIRATAKRATSKPLVEMVRRTQWGNRLGIKTDGHQEMWLRSLTGYPLRNAHERDAACLSRYGQRVLEQGARRTA